MQGNPFIRHSVEISNVIASLLCLLLFFAELITDDMQYTALGIVMMIVYCICLILIPMFCVPISCILIVQSLIRWVVPISVISITDYWGVWYALVILGAKGKRIWSVAGAVTNMIACCMDAFILDGALSSGAVGVSSFYLFASLIGISLYWRYETVQSKAEKVLVEQENAYKENQFHLFHELHDSLAGKLVYGVLLCREIKGTTYVDEDKIDDLEIVLQDALQELRTEVIASLRHDISQSDMSVITENEIDEHLTLTRKDLIALLSAIERRFKAIGMTGSVFVDKHWPDLRDSRVIRYILLELENNVIKHGDHSLYSIVFSCDDSNTLRIFFSNSYDGDTTCSEQCFSSLSTLVDELGGAIDINTENHEWSVAITFNSF